MELVDALSEALEKATHSGLETEVVFYLSLNFWQFFYYSSSEQVNLVSAILRTITQVLDSEASLNKSSILYAPVQARSSLETIKEVDVINEVKLEISNDVDHIDEENFVVEGENKNAKEHQDDSREPGEISDRSVEDWP